MNTAAAFADFRTYPLISALKGVQVMDDHVLVEWADNRVSRFIISGYETTAPARNASTPSPASRSWRSSTFRNSWCPQRPASKLKAA